MPTYVEDTTDGGQDRATKYYYIIPTYEGLNESYLTTQVLQIPSLEAVVETIEEIEDAGTEISRLLKLQDVAEEMLNQATQQQRFQVMMNAYMHTYSAMDATVSATIAETAQSSKKGPGLGFYNLALALHKTEAMKNKSSLTHGFY